MADSNSFTFANKGSLLNVDLKYVNKLDEVQLNKSDSILIVGKPKDLRAIQYAKLENVFQKIEVPKEWLQESINYVAAEKSNDENGSSPANGSSVTWLNKLIINKVSDKCSRHNTPSKAHSFSEVIRKNAYGENQLIIASCERQNSVAVACAIARSFPLYSSKTDEKKKRNVFVKFVYSDTNEEQSDEETKCFNTLAESVRLTAKIMDSPCAEMNTDDFLEEIKKVGKELNIEPYVIDGEELNKRGFGGIYNVGKAAIHTPKLVVLSHLKPNAKRTIAWVGKGIVYDTGGLNLKARTAMLTMKNDCGGAAGILGAFRAAVHLGFEDNLHALFCLAENAIGPIATRPDDVIKLYSGKTVEVTNTDAEGRLVLGDGVAYAKKDLKADIIVDMATLTSAQGVATGKYHAGLLTNQEKWEQLCFNVGKLCGDLCFPLVFAPEIHFSEFDSEVADMTNCVIRPNNAASACAGLFIHSHLGSDYTGTWVHLDIAYPSTDGARSTGYGVSLLNSLFGDSSSSVVLRELRNKITDK